MNFKRIIAIGAVVGMLAVTGCSMNTPDRNEANYNGERLSAAVNRRAGTTRGLFGRNARRTERRNDNYAQPNARIGNTFGYGMNRTDRGIPSNGINRAVRRQNNEVRREINGIGLNDGIGRNAETAPVAAIDNDTFAFFKKATPAPEQPEQTPAPAPAAPAPAAFDGYDTEDVISDDIDDNDITDETTEDGTDETDINDEPVPETIKPAGRLMK